jgi:hypothetical protein
MKISSLILVASLLANAALLAAYTVVSRPSINGTRPLVSSAGAKAVSGMDTVGSKANGVQATAQPRAVQNLWSRLYADDVDEFAARLRAAGFPPKAVRAIIMESSYRKYEAARTSIMGRREDVPYWKVVSYEPEDPGKKAKLADLQAEQSKFYRKFLNSPEVLLEDEETAMRFRSRFGDLSIEKLQVLSKIEGDYSEMREQLYRQLQARRAEARSPAEEVGAADREKLMLLEAEQQRDIQQALTPEEFEQYQLRSSPTASRLRSQLELFRPTEAEYKTLFAFQRTIDEQFRYGRYDENTAKAYTAAMDQLKPQIQAAFGPERYDEYVQAMEHGSDKLNRLMARLDMPLSTAGKITAVRQDITQRADAIRADSQLAPAERDAQLSALATEAKTRLTTTLGGERGYQAYNDMKGDWIRALQPKSDSSHP